MTTPAATGGDKPADTVMLDAEARALKLDQVKAEARKAIAQADRAVLDEALPPAPAKPPEGTVGVSDTSGLVAELAAYAVLTRCAERVAAAVPDDATVLVVEDRDLVASDWPYLVVDGELTRHQKDLEQAREALAGAKPAQDGLAFVGAVVAAAGVIASAASIVGMFRSDYSFTGRALSIAPASLTAAVVHQLRARKTPPEVVVDAFQLLTGSAVFERLSALRDQAADARRSAANLDVEHLAPRERTLQRLGTQITEAEATRAEALDKGEPTDAVDARLAQLRGEEDEAVKGAAPLRSAVRAAEKVLDRIDAFVTAVTALPATGYPIVVAAAVRERLHADQKPVTHVLHAAAGSAGGETVTRRSLWRSSIAFVGGCHVSYLLLDVQTGVVTGGHHAAVATLPWDLRKNQPGSLTISEL